MSKKFTYNKEKVVVVKYSGQSRFRVPEGIDIQAYLDSGKAFVHWNKLHILQGEPGEDNNYLAIACHEDAEDNIDWKRGDDVSVEDLIEFVDGREEEGEYEEEDDF
jgi:hypothetical protein